MLTLPSGTGTVVTAVAAPPPFLVTGGAGTGAVVGVGVGWTMGGIAMEVCMAVGVLAGQEMVVTAIQVVEMLRRGQSVTVAAQEVTVTREVW